MPRPLSETARTKMLDAAQEIVVADGLDACTVDEVARRSGVAKTTIYRHFKNADELVIAAIECLKPDVDVPDTGTLAGDLRATIEQFIDTVDPAVSRRLFVSMLHRALDDPQFEAAFRSSREAEHGPLRRVVQRAIARGEVDPEIDVSFAMQFLQGPFLVQHLLRPDTIAVDDRLDQLIELSCRALAPRRVTV